MQERGKKYGKRTRPSSPDACDFTKSVSFRLLEAAAWFVLLFVVGRTICLSWGVPSGTGYELFAWGVAAGAKGDSSSRSKPSRLGQAVYTVHDGDTYDATGQRESDRTRTVGRLHLESRRRPRNRFVYMWLPHRFTAPLKIRIYRWQSVSSTHDCCWGLVLLFLGSPGRSRHKVQNGSVGNSRKGVF